MKNTLLFCIIISSMAVYAQKVKTVEISRSNAGVLSCRYITDATKADTNILLLAQDNRYQQLIEFLVLFSGSPIEAVEFFTEVENIVNENEPNTSVEVNGQTVYIYSKSRFMLYDFRGSNGYHVYTPNNWARLKDDLINYIESNGL